MEIRQTVALLLAIKVGFMVFCISFFPMRRLIGVGKDWLLSTTSTKDIMKELRTEKYVSEELNSFNVDGKTGLMLAVGRADLDLVKAFVNAGADINVHAADSVGDTALHIACYNGNFQNSIEIIEFLVNVKSRISNAFVADVSARNKRGETPLLHTIQISNIENRKKVIKWLVDRGAHINEQDNNGNTLFHMAVNNKDDYGVQMLLDTFGDSIDFNITNHNYEKRMTPLEYAWYLGFRDVATRIEKGIEGIDALKRNRGRFQESRAKEIKRKYFYY